LKDTPLINHKKLIQLSTIPVIYLFCHPQQPIRGQYRPFWEQMEEITLIANNQPKHQQSWS
jgi:hypothetical protein